MRRREDFTAATRRGVRGRADTLVLHHLTAAGAGGADSSPAPASVGFVVGKAVGNSVVRHRVARRLRAQSVPLLAALPDGSRTVVRALPPAATASSVALSNDLDSAWARARRSRR